MRRRQKLFEEVPRTKSQGSIQKGCARWSSLCMHRIPSDAVQKNCEEVHDAQTLRQILKDGVTKRDVAQHCRWPVVGMLHMHASMVSKPKDACRSKGKWSLLGFHSRRTLWSERPESEASSTAHSFHETDCTVKGETESSEWASGECTCQIGTHLQPPAKITNWSKNYFN